MSTIADIERVIEQLSPDEMQVFREWSVAREAVEWDRQFEADAAAGKLDVLAEEAIRDHREGRCTDL